MERCKKNFPARAPVVARPLRAGRAGFFFFSPLYVFALAICFLADFFLLYLPAVGLRLFFLWTLPRRRLPRSLTAYCGRAAGAALPRSSQPLPASTATQQPSSHEVLLSLLVRLVLRRLLFVRLHLVSLRERGGNSGQKSKAGGGGGGAKEIRKKLVQQSSAGRRPAVSLRTAQPNTGSKQKPQ